MSEAFDKILVRKMREVFDSNEEPMDLAAWEDIQARLDRKQKKKNLSEWVIRMAAVALLLVFLFIPVRETEKITIPKTENLSNMKYRKTQNQKDENSGGSKQSSHSKRTVVASDDHERFSESELPDSKQLFSSDMSMKEPGKDRNSRNASTGLKKLTPIIWSIPGYSPRLKHLPGVDKKEEATGNLQA